MALLTGDLVHTSVTDVYVRECALSGCVARVLMASQPARR